MTDLRSVYRDISPELRDKFAAKGIQYVRRYDGPGKSRFSLWKTKRWDEMFSTVDRAEVEKKAQAQNFQLEWLHDGGLKILNKQSAFRRHPATKLLAWHNHSQTFHFDAAAIEYSYIAKRQHTLRAYAVSAILHALTFAKRLLRKPQEQDVNALYGDGTPIKRHEIREVLSAFWKNLSIFQWQEGDILFIDNFAVSHGRLPYSGPREILVAWTNY